ncbi:MAG TPA: glycoside hydrolase domain-containing protein [Longimicrobium sp.]|nr:glycoside hydrolase domain-containing protein [Longimicrobium sp.]
MRIHLAFLVVIVAAGCGTVPPAATIPRPALAAHPGFDLDRYPGDAALQAWRRASPYEWVGYYLPAPCHRDASWSGRRPAIAAMGYGFAVLYVGQQQFEGDTTPPRPGVPIVCSRTLLTAERGQADAADAATRAAAEGFPAGTAVFLDVERFTTLTPEMSAYVGAWTATMRRDGRYRPAVYAHRDNAAALRALVEGAGGAPVPFWVAGGLGFSVERTPRDGGVEFATVWQGLPGPRSWGGITLTVDENVASTASPSSP